MQRKIFNFFINTTFELYIKAYSEKVDTFLSEYAFIFVLWQAI